MIQNEPNTVASYQLYYKINLPSFKSDNSNLVKDYKIEFSNDPVFTLIIEAGEIDCSFKEGKPIPIVCDLPIDHRYADND